MPQRLSKVLAQFGVASRRESERIIASGRVQVNGRVVKAVVPVEQNDVITLDGQLLKTPPFVYYAFNKPANVVTTMQDEKSRKHVADYFKNIPARVYPVGRLDSKTTGLLLVTNDGKLALKIGHPKFHLAKTYKVTVAGIPTDAELERLRHGVRLAGKKTAPAIIQVLHVNTKLKTMTLVITIHEGRNRQIRRMFEIVHHTVLSIERIQVGPVTLDTLSIGKLRPLTPEEIAALRAL